MNDKTIASNRGAAWALLILFVFLPLSLAAGLAALLGIVHFWPLIVSVSSALGHVLAYVLSFGWLALGFAFAGFTLCRAVWRWITASYQK
jgi:hypothetical protein